MTSSEMTEPLFFIGVGGTGMAPLAAYELLRGNRVFGSDRSEHGYSGLLSKLVDLGLRAFPQDGSGIEEMQRKFGNGFICVRTPAVEDTVADVVAARALGVEPLSRSNFLARIVNDHPKSVAVAGTAGKSTVTGMGFHLLRQCGFDPSYISGSPLVGSGIAAVGKGPLLIEADESDLSLLEYKPWGAVLLNIHRDHHDTRRVAEAFSTFLGHVRDGGFVVFNSDCPLVSAVVKPLIPELSSRGIRTFGFGTADHDEASFPVSDVSPVQGGWGSNFKFSSFPSTVPFPGGFQVFNASAAIALSVCCGVDAKSAAAAMADYSGIERRFQLRGESHGIRVVDDFAHNPEEIRQAVKAATDLTPLVTAIYQPHGFGPTRFTFDDLVDAVSAFQADRVRYYVADIFYGGGTVDKDVNSEQIVNEARKKNPRASVSYAPSLERLAEEVAASTPEGALVLVMGARDINRICPMILEGIGRN